MNKEQFLNLRRASKKRPIFLTPNTIKFLTGSLTIVVAYTAIKNYTLRSIFISLVSTIAILLAVSVIFRTVQYFRAQYYYSRFPLLVEEIKEMNIKNLGEYISLLSNIYTKFGYIPNDYNQFNETVSSSILSLMGDTDINLARISFKQGESRIVKSTEMLDLVVGTKKCKEEIFRF